MRTSTIPLWTGLIPILAIHISYVIAASQGHVDWCNPYWDSCTSISATGRTPPEFYWFKLTLIPTALLMMFYWQRLTAWQISLGSTTTHWTRWSGYAAAAFLILYVIALGIEGDGFRLQRRIGAVLYFTLTYLAQLLTVAWLWRRGFRSRAVKLMLFLCAICLFVGLCSLATDLLTDWHDEVDDAYEWLLALLLHLYFIVSYWVVNSSQPEAQHA